MAESETTWQVCEQTSPMSHGFYAPTEPGSIYYKALILDLGGRGLDRNFQVVWVLGEPEEARQKKTAEAMRRCVATTRAEIYPMTDEERARDLELVLASSDDELVIMINKLRASLDPNAWQEPNSEVWKAMRAVKKAANDSMTEALAEALATPGFTEAWQAQHGKAAPK